MTATTVSWAQDAIAFRAACDTARRRVAMGEPPVPYQTADATAGVSRRDGGRAFGVEIEFDVEPGLSRRRALLGIAHQLHAAGLVQRPLQRRYHAGRRDAAGWRYETDRSVDGEIISPMLFDEPESWHQLARVCEIVHRHGGRATARTGGHVHVDVSDYGSTTESHDRLLRLFKAHEDTLYRLSQNPARHWHRGARWCAPNPPPGPSTETPTALALHHSGHGVAVNFAAVTHRRSGDHVEFRLWDSSLDPAVIQVHVKLSLGLAEAALGAWGELRDQVEPLGTHWRRGGTAGDADADSRSFRLLVDRTLRREVDKVQAAALFAITRWQRGRPPTPHGAHPL